MPSMLPKPKSANAWLPSQVVYGMDCSDPDPVNWKPFGTLHDQVEAAAAAAKPSSASKPSLPGQAARPES